ncbi:hypothetical protein V5O48_018766, partial [Marasmius crinis-equi]
VCCSSSRNAALKKSPDIAINRVVGDPQTWVMPLHGAGITVLRKLMGCLFGLSSAVQGLFYLVFGLVIRCLWQTEYTVAPPCENLRSHDSQSTIIPCDACNDDGTLESDLPEIVHKIVRRNNPNLEGMDEIVRLEVADAVHDKVPYIYGARGTDMYPDGNTIMSIILRLRTPFSMLHYKPWLVIDFSPDQNQPLPMRTILHVQIPGCYPKSNTLILNMTTDAQTA